MRKAGFSLPVTVLLGFSFLFAYVGAWATDGNPPEIFGLATSGSTSTAEAGPSPKALDGSGVALSETNVPASFEITSDESEAAKRTVRAATFDEGEPQTSSTFTVLNVSDAGPGSLRDAILYANSSSGLDTIEFAVGQGHRVIQPLTALPEIAESVILDATTQPGYVDRPLIELDGSLIPESPDPRQVAGLRIGAGFSTVRGFVINRFSGSGLILVGEGSNVVSGNYIGTDVTGTLDRGNTMHGIYVDRSSRNVIGGTTAGERNVISANQLYGIVIAQPTARDNIVMGNYLGTDVTGSSTLGNGRTGLLIWNADSNTIGGLRPGSGNVISGNGRTGLNIDGTCAPKRCPVGVPSMPQSIPTGFAKYNLVVGNLIGTDATGTQSLGNGLHGILIHHASDNMVGGTEPGTRNIISVSANYGVYIQGPGGTRNTISGNYIGTDITGSVPMGNGRHGVLVNKASSNIIGGFESGSGNVIADNAQYGVTIRDVTSTGNVVAGNLIGTDAAGTTGLGNALGGVAVLDAHSNTIGGGSASARNVISGNDRYGVLISGAKAVNNVVSGNFIGTLEDGLTGLANASHGVIVAGARSNTIGGTAPANKNTIAFNRGNGVNLTKTSLGNAIVGNAIFSNFRLGIDLGNDAATANDRYDADEGPNRLQNHPEIRSAMVLPNRDLQITYRVDSTKSNAAYPLRIEFFQSDDSGKEGGIYLGADIYEVEEAGADTTATFRPVIPPLDDPDVLATATDSGGNTSEFSEAVQLTDLLGRGSFGMVAGQNGRLAKPNIITLSSSFQNTVLEYHPASVKKTTITSGKSNGSKTNILTGNVDYFQSNKN